MVCYDFLDAKTKTYAFEYLNPLVPKKKYSLEAGYLQGIEYGDIKKYVGQDFDWAQMIMDDTNLEMLKILEKTLIIVEELRELSSKYLNMNSK